VDTKRPSVLQIGRADVALKPFAERLLELVPCEQDQVAAQANSACGILIAENGARVGFIRSCFEALRDTAEDNGLAFAVLLPSAAELKVVEALVSELALKSPVVIKLIADAGHAAEFLARRAPGPPTGNPKVLPSDLVLSPRIELLLKRSFHDCDRIYMEPLGGGKDAAGVFCVHAWLRKSIVGPRPLPFFIKFSEPDKIRGERHNYGYYADFYIPFYLRPNLVAARCAEIKGLASLVGNFVEDAVPLRTTLRAGQSPGTIFSLFEISLRGFRSQPTHAPAATWDSPLQGFVRDRARASSVQDETIRLARTLGLKATPTELETSLCDTIGSVTRKFSPYHGDLHAGNVMVRGNDAILIDFSAVKNGPLTADPATLEVSMVFGTDQDDKPTEFEEWKKAVGEFYNGVPIHEPPSPGTGPGPFAWLYKAVREVRHVLLGCDCKQEEAAEVLAAYLLRFARLTPEQFDDNDLSELARKRQAYALVVAERIITTFAARKSTGTT
jgi:hypothetical protein